MIHAFWSDPHFFHKKIIDHSERPFSSLEEMNEALIANYNAVVGKNDICLWGGDCFFCKPEPAREIMGRLNGIKALVLGNHDRSAATMFSIGFSFVADEMFMKMANRRVRVKHYPYWMEPAVGTPILDRHGRPMKPEIIANSRKVAPPRVPGEVLLHGHTHNRKRRRDNMVHIGVDAWGFRPATWAEVEEEVAKI